MTPKPAWIYGRGRQERFQGEAVPAKQEAFEKLKRWLLPRLRLRCQCARGWEHFAGVCALGSVSTHNLITAGWAELPSAGRAVGRTRVFKDLICYLRAGGFAPGYRCVIYRRTSPSSNVMVA